jgi:NAD(P) transhydrogenase subunit alpha
MPITIGVLREVTPGETRVALVPEVAGKFRAAGARVLVERGAGVQAQFPDSLWKDVEFAATAAEVLAAADVLIKVQPPTIEEVAGLKPGAVSLSFVYGHQRPDVVRALRDGHITAFAMELVPRISRAQSMDALSSQASTAGYQAALIAALALDRFLPMLTTAAGTIRPAQVLVIGAGVAGLQAIATAKRLGAVIEAFDVRPAVKEQVESLGAKFVEVPVSEEEKRQAETAGGYAREMSEDYKRRQSALIDERSKAADIIITTALIPGRPAPVLVREETVRGMKPGSVIVDLAVEQGGNCPLSERDKVVVKHDVKIVGHTNLAAMLAADASALYARNVLNFVNLLVDPKSGTLKLDRADEIIVGSLVCIDGTVVKKG